MRQSPQPKPGRVRRLNRPRKWIIGLSTVVLVVGLANLARGALAVGYAIRLPELPMTVSWAYLSATGVVWGLVLAALAVCLAAFYRWARMATLAAVTMHQAHVWINHLLFDANDYARGAWPRDLVVTALFLAVVWGMLSLPIIRREFER
jgi:hypothetical protein